MSAFSGLTQYASFQDCSDDKVRMLTSMHNCSAPLPMSNHAAEMHFSTGHSSSQFMPFCAAGVQASVMLCRTAHTAGCVNGSHNRRADLQGSHVSRGLQLSPFLQGPAHKDEAQQHGRLLKKGFPAEAGQPGSNAADPKAGGGSQAHQGAHVGGAPPPCSPPIYYQLTPWP